MTIRTALITGASRGIGKACALALSESGARVALSARSLDQLEDVAGLVRDRGGDSFVAATDLSDADSIKETAARVRENAARRSARRSAGR